MSRNQSITRKQKGRNGKGRSERSAEEPLAGQALTIKQVANSLQVSVKTVQRLIKAGKLDTIKVGREYRILPEGFEAFLRLSRSSVDTGSNVSATDIPDIRPDSLELAHNDISSHPRTTSEGY